MAADIVHIRYNSSVSTTFIPSLSSTVHIRLQGAGTVARKLGIDYAQAMCGFDIRKGRTVPLFDGIVVCAEYADTIRDAIVQNERARLEKLEKQRERVIYRRWKQLIQGLIIQDRVFRLHQAAPLRDGKREQNCGSLPEQCPEISLPGVEVCLVDGIEIERETF